jgi:hypothetical protein
MGNQARGLSLHIGLEHVDGTKYRDGFGNPWDGALAPCEIDAKDMAALAESQGFVPTLLLTAEATADAILGKMREAAEQLAAGDIFFVTFSGHGGRVDDLNSEEPDQKDETWVAYDRQVADDELFHALSRFAPGVRVVVASDSCHSGSVHIVGPSLPEGAKAMPKNIEAAEQVARGPLYEEIQRTVPDAGLSVQRLSADVLLLSACADDELAFVGPRHSVFTAVLLRVWDKGRFQGSYRDFHRAIVEGVGSIQTPQLSPPTGTDPAFADQRPFTI